MNIGEIVSQLQAERTRIEKAITALEGLSTNGASRVEHQVAVSSTRRRGHLTAEGRKRLSEMMKRRWAERRRKASSKK